MGEQVAARQFTRADRTRYRQKVRRCLDVFERMLSESRFDFDRPMVGLEIELNLVDDLGNPTMRNAEVLGAIADPDFQTELGQFNIEINIPPLTLDGRSLDELEQTLRADLNHAEHSARAVDAELMMIGILPTLMAEHLSLDSLTANPRYKLLNEQIFAARGEDIWLDISGDERLRTSSDSIAPEAACTSVQCHL
ncbi:MAG: glutamate--cysteine ligase, partial [Actinomycetales bacterium]